LRAQRGPLKGLNVPLTAAAVIVVLGFLTFGAWDPAYAEGVFQAASTWVIGTFKWYYIGVVAFFLAFALFLMFSRFGDLRLGDDDRPPEFSYFAWFSMLFGAGMGIGLLFWSIAEPIWHFQGNPFVEEGETKAAAETAMRLTYFHWGLHPWAIYAIVALSLAFFSYRMKLPLAIRSALYPLIGKRIYGPIGHAADAAHVLCPDPRLASREAAHAALLAAGAGPAGGAAPMTGHEGRRTPWEARWREGRTGWDRGGASPALGYWLEAGAIPGERILVPGAGSGYEAVALAQAGFQVTAVDIAAGACQRLRGLLAAAGAEAEVVQADLLHWQPAQAFDAVYEQTCLCALDPADWPAYERCLHQWLRPGGALLAQFLQTGEEGGPPHHCPLPAMERLFPPERWRWPDEPPACWPHPGGRREEAVRLLRR